MTYVYRKELTSVIYSLGNLWSYKGRSNRAVVASIALWYHRKSFADAKGG
jgi:hypothetical protein